MNFARLIKCEAGIQEGSLEEERANVKMKE